MNDVGSAADKRPRLTEQDGPAWGFHVADVNLALGNLDRGRAAAGSGYRTVYALVMRTMAVADRGGGNSASRSGHVDLEELHRLGQAAKPPGAEAPEADALGERLDDRRVHGGGHHDLAAVRASRCARRRGPRGRRSRSRSARDGRDACRFAAARRSRRARRRRASRAGSRAPPRARPARARRPRRGRRRGRRPRGRRPGARRRAPGGGRRRAARRSRPPRRPSSSVEPSMSVSRNVTRPVGSLRCGFSCALTKPIGTIPCFFAALSSRVRARSRAASSSNTTWLNRARALRTRVASWIGRRRRPRESMYANALSGSCARSFAPSGGMPA